MKTDQILLRTCLGIAMVGIYAYVLQRRFAPILAGLIDQKISYAFQVKAPMPFRSLLRSTKAGPS
jgi:hypothetical protein